jgi:hypothetical protein
MIHGAGGYSPLDFSAAATNNQIAYIVVEQKVCEADGCGKIFMRNQGSGQVVCGVCLAREHAHRVAAWEAAKAERSAQTYRRYQRGN